MTPIAVCIVAFRDAALIVRCLQTLAMTRFDDFEVVICENGGAAAFAELSALLPAALPNGQQVTAFAAPGNVGFAGGVNLCMAARPDARAWWILNPDAEAEPDALGALVARLEQGDVDAVGGLLYHPAGTVQGYGGRWRARLARAESIGYGAPADAPVDVAAVERRIDYLLGACMLVGRRFVERAGLMREDYFLYAEEVEWCLRAKALGARFGFAPAARVRHGQGGTTGSAETIARRPRLPIYMDERNKLHVVRDTAPGTLPLAVLGSLGMTAMRFARRGAWRQWRYALAGWWAGVRNRRGLPPWMR